MLAPQAAEIRTTCPYCGVGCGILARITPNGQVAVRGDPDHPANFGKLCSKGTALGETTGLEGRLLSPEVDGRETSWDVALDVVARRFTETTEKHGPNSVAFYVSGQLLTEDYYVANKLMKGFIGSANIDTNSRLCMASSVAGHRRAFGEDIVPGNYQDFEQSGLITLAGSNAAWCHPVLYQRMLAARRECGTKIVVIDPRVTATAEEADLHLAIEPGMDVLLFNGLLAHLARANAIDRDYISERTSGFVEAVNVALADAPSVEHVARSCGLNPADVRTFYELFAAETHSVTVYSQGINQSAHGTDKVNAIINCHLATGRVGQRGMGPFSVTGQPNAMGGREVGGLANQLAAHMNFDCAEIDRVSRFWKAPNIARAEGLKAVDLFQAVENGRIKALWIMGTNPAASMPEASRVRAALRNCDFVVVSDITRTDTTRFADVLFPAAAWGEKSGTVTNSERRVSRQRSFLPLPGQARPDWRIICDVAGHMGFADAFDYDGPGAIFREHSALSAFENEGSRLFDIGAFADLCATEYDDLAPFQWPKRRDGQPAERLLTVGQFPTSDGRARFIAVRHEGVAKQTDATHPLALNSGRLRDQWHTMTRTGRVPRLMSHVSEPIVEIAALDARRLGLTDGDLVRLSNSYGFARAKMRISTNQKPGSAFLPMHWSGQYAANAAAGMLASPLTDPFSGQPELKHVPIRIMREEVVWQGVLVTRRDLRPIGFVHWSRYAVTGGWVYELCGTEAPDQGILLSRQLMAGHPHEQRLEYTDRRGHNYRTAAIDDDMALTEALMVSPQGQLPPRDWLVTLLGSRQRLSTAARMALLSAHSPVQASSSGRIVCSCFNVGMNQIAATLAAGCQSVEDVGARIRAGTNCGSCRSEIRRIIHDVRLQSAR